MQQIWARFRLDVLAVSALLFVLFLFVEPFGVKRWASRLLTTSASAADGFSGQVFDSLEGLVLRQSRADLAGLFLLVGTVGFLILSVRWHFQHSPRRTSRTCPVCDAKLGRIHRTDWDRLFGAFLFLPVRRYLCHNPDCRWSGLRYHKRRRRRSRHKR